jgi:hypothetical protein
MKYYLLICLVAMHTIAFSQVMGTTDDGRRVKLNSNGTWEYVSKTSDTDSAKAESFSKSVNATTQVKSTKNDFGFWYDKSKWKMGSKDDNADAEFALEHIDGDSYAMFLAERIEIDLENLKDIAVENAKELDPDVKVDVETNRIVNGQKVKYLQMSGQTKGVKFVYQGYYTSNESGTVQFVCFTGRSLLKMYEKDMQELLNGLAKVK